MKLEGWRWVLWNRIHAAAPWENPFWKANLAAMYAAGSGVAKNERKAARLYRKAAEKGHAGAQFNLGFMYLLGEGVRDASQARRWMEMAAAGGDVQAARLLADPQVQWE